MARGQQVTRRPRAAWLKSFHSVVLDYKEGWIDLDQFKARLQRLGFPDGYVSWLAAKVEYDD